MMTPPHYEIALMAVRMGMQVAGLARGLLRSGQLLAGHLLVNLTDVL